MDNILNLTYLGILAPLVTALVQGLKLTPILKGKSKWNVLASLACGVLLSGLFTLGWPPAGMAVGTLVAYGAIHGMVGGLVASGLYSFAISPVSDAIAARKAA